MSKNCLISVIVPVYNVEKYVFDCIQSILNNSLKDFELILIDDGSTDNSFNIISSFKDERIKIISKENGGLSSARNAGLDAAVGEYITFVDSDDIVDVNYLKIMYEEAITCNSKLVFCNYIRFSETVPAIDSNSYSKVLLSRDDFYNSEDYITKVISCAKLYKREIFDNLRFEFGRYHEDEFLYTKLFNLLGENIVYINKELYFYRFNENGIMNSAINNKKLIDWCDAYLDRLYYFDEIHYYNKSAFRFYFSHLNWVIFKLKWKFAPVKKASIIRRLYKIDFKYSKTSKHKIYCLLHLTAPLLCKLFFHNRLRSRLGTFKFKLTNWLYYLKCRYFKRAKVVYLGSINHGNLGDHAICIAALNLMKKNKIKCFDLTQKEFTPRFKKWIKSKKITIALRGGGNIGNVWLNEEQFHRDVINEFNDNKIIFFPESIYFTNDEEGMKESLISSEIYSKHENLTIFVRDRISLERGKKIFPKNKLVLVPDIVFSLKESLKQKNISDIKKVLFLIRNDKESNEESVNSINELMSYFREKNVVVEVSNTVIKNNNIKRNQRDKILTNFFNNMLSADLIVTDRLHGMIFSYILGVPFIAFDNSNKKVESAFEWIENFGCGVLGKTADLNNLTFKNFQNHKIDEKLDFSELINVLISN